MFTSRQFLIGGLIVPLVATVGINGKVNFLEKFGTSEFPNTTGAYELDLTLVNDFEHAWRELHVKSDVFCSASIVLPDKGGRQLNIGGWSLDSTFGVRLYTPDGSAGVNGTNDWEENFEELHLQVCVVSMAMKQIYISHIRWLAARTMVPILTGHAERFRLGRRWRSWQ